MTTEGSESDRTALEALAEMEFNGREVDPALGGFARLIDQEDR